MYFWQDAPQRAQEWSKTWHRAKRVQSKRAIVQATLRLEDCMDLLDNDWNELLRQAPKAFQEKLRQQGITLANIDSKTGRNRLDCAFFNYLVDSLNEQGTLIRAIRTAVTEGDVILPYSPICFDSHVQIAVRDVSLISDVRLVHTE